MYKAPDFVKVSTKMKDVFAGYGCDYHKGQYSADLSKDPTCGNPGEIYTYIEVTPASCWEGNTSL